MTMEHKQARLVVGPAPLKASLAHALGVAEPASATHTEARAAALWTWWVGSTTEADVTHTARLGLIRATVHVLQSTGADILIVFDLEASAQARQSLCRAARELFMLFASAAQTPRVTLLALNVDVSLHMQAEAPLPKPETQGDAPRNATPAVQLTWMEALWRSPAMQSQLKVIRVAPFAEIRPHVDAGMREGLHDSSVSVQLRQRLNRLATWSTPPVYVALAQTQALTLAARLWSEAPAGTYHLCADPPKPWSVVEPLLKRDLDNAAFRRIEARYRVRRAPSTAQTRGALARLGLRLPHSSLPKLGNA